MATETSGSAFGILDGLKKEFQLKPNSAQLGNSPPPEDPTLRLSMQVSSSDISMSTDSMSSGPFIPREESLFMLMFRLNRGGWDGVGNNGGLWLRMLGVKFVID